MCRYNKKRGSKRCAKNRKNPVKLNNIVLLIELKPPPPKKSGYTSERLKNQGIRILFFGVKVYKVVMRAEHANFTGTTPLFNQGKIVKTTSFIEKAK